LIDYEQFCSINDGKPLDLTETITAKELALQLKSAHPPLLLDVRTPVESQVSAFHGAISIPLERLAEHISELDKDQEIVIFCRTGTRSKRALRQMQEKGFTHVRDLTGGINAWAQQVDATMFQY
jgi:adenylyltransferase/sulfurtransferase